MGVICNSVIVGVKTRSSAIVGGGIESSTIMGMIRSSVIVG